MTPIDAVPEPQVKALIAAAGIPVPRGRTAPGAQGLARAAAGLSAPLVLKAHGPGIVHKSEHGAVVLGLDGPAAVVGAAERMGAALAGRGLVPAGFLVEEQVGPGVELIVGAVRDASFGPVLLVGLGGIWAEVLDDTTLRLCPIDRDDAEAMLGDLRGAALLNGARGAPPVDREALADLLVAVGGPGGVVERLGPVLGQFELNPVIAGPGGAVAADARLIPAEGTRAPAVLPVPGREVRAGAERRSAPGPEPTTASGAPRGPEPLAAPETDFGPLFAPRGVAVVGASARRPGFGNMLLGQYRAAGFPGTLLAVHPEATEVDGVPAVPSLRAAAGRVDYALVALPAAACADAVREADGIPFVQVVSGGFAESGPEGADLERGLLAAARGVGTRLLGPNCMGVYSPAGGQTFLGGPAAEPGRIALLSQSGGLAGEVVWVGERRGLRFSQVATLGNSADVSPAELVRHLDADPATGVLGLYLEDPRDGRALFEALRAARGRLPTVVLAGGRSAQGRRAAASHTGGMVADDRVWRALARQCGTGLVHGQDALIGALDFLELHAGRRIVGGGPGVLVVGPSGGAGVLAADAFDAAGMRLDPPGERARAALRALGLGAGAPLGNPLEVPVGPRGDPRLLARAAEAVALEHGVPDVVAHINVQSFAAYAEAAAPGATATPGAAEGGPREAAADDPAFARLPDHVGALAALQAALPGTRVTLVLRNSECGPPELADRLRASARTAGIPVYTSMEAAASAVAAGKAALSVDDRAG
ncbi:acetate--CoA ligase family protein [Nocardiopsis sediminis]|uniref:Acetate--CoA ligase family protein n=1 Tax=Nocardiopsis sediminis TaxID=1778267 RepID=A0ABV8FXH6_9ACTN